MSEAPNSDGGPVWALPMEGPGHEARQPAWPDVPSFARAEDIDPAALDRKTFAVALDGLTYGCRLSRSPQPAFLFVVLSSYVDRAVDRPPVFVRGPVPLRRHGHVLRISDPTLFLDETLPAGVFLGSERGDPIAGLLAIAAEVARRSNIPPRRIVFIGGSGAGFGALMAAARMGDGRAVAFNPQINMLGIDEDFGSAWVKVFRPGSSIAAICTDYPARTSVIAAVQDARAAGHNPRLLIYQNTVDHHYFKTQYSEFCRFFGIPPDGGADPSGRLQTATYAHPEGHSAPPPDADVVERILRW